MLKEPEVKQLNNNIVDKKDVNWILDSLEKYITRKIFDQ